MRFGATAVLACVIALAGTHPAIAQTGTVKAAIDASNKKFSEALAAGNAAGVAAGCACAVPATASASIAIQRGHERMTISP